MGGDSEQKEGGEHKSWWQSLLGLPHGATEFAEGLGATKEVVEGAENVKHIMSPLGIGLTPALESAAEGAPSFMQTVRQAQFAAGGSGGMTMASKLLAPLALFSGASEMWDSGKEMKEHGAGLDNTKDMTKGVLETTAGGIGTLGLIGSGLSWLGGATGLAGLGGAGAAASAGAAAAAPVGMVAGAGAAGMAVGDLMAHAADSDKTKTGLWGKTEGGQNKSAMDWGAGWGTWVDSHTGDKNPAHPSVLGGIAAGAGGIVSGALGTAQWGGNTTVGIGKSIGNWAKHLF
jgi:hypothetical protein